MTPFLLRSLSRKNQDKGFTLIELLVVIIIIGILAAIALPSFLNQANKARQAEAETYVGAMNRAQQAYYLENREFSADIVELELGLSNTENYTYVIDNVTATGVGAGSDQLATPTGADLKGYRGTTWLGVGTDGNATTLARLCEGEPGVVPDCDRVLPVAP